MSWGRSGAEGVRIEMFVYLGTKSSAARAPPVCDDMCASDVGEEGPRCGSLIARQITLFIGHLRGKNARKNMVAGFWRGD